MIGPRSCHPGAANVDATVGEVATPTQVVVEAVTLEIMVERTPAAVVVEAAAMLRMMNVATAARRVIGLENARRRSARRSCMPLKWRMRRSPLSYSPVPPSQNW
jgi:hypothetical protein